MSQKALASSMVAPMTARYRLVSPPPTAALLTWNAGSKMPSLSTLCAFADRYRTCSIATRRICNKNTATVLYATASDSTEIADDNDDAASPTLTSSCSSSSSVPADLVEVATFGAPHGVRGEVRIFLVTDEPEERLLAGVERGSRFWVAPQVESSSRGSKAGGGGILLGRRGSSSPAAAAPKPRLVRIEAARPAPISRSSQKGSAASASVSISWLLKLRGIDSPEAAAALANTSLWMSAAERPALPESGDDFYAQELIGMEARLGEKEGKLVGVVVDVCGGGGTDLLRLELSDEEEEEEVEEEVVEEEEVEEGDEAAATAAQRRRRQRQRKARLPPPPVSAARRTVLLPFTQAFVPHVDRQLRRMTICPPDGLLDLAILPPKAQLKQEREAALATAAAVASGANGEGSGTGGEKKQTRPRRPRGRRARDRAGGGTAAPPSA